MSMALSDPRPLLHDVGHRLRGRKEVIARAAERAVRLAGRANWPRVAGAAAVGFVVGVALLGGRKAAMQATTAIAGDWFAALKADHRAVDGLFNLLLETRDEEAPRRRLLAARIADALARHQFEEEHVIYPALFEGGSAQTPRHLDAEHFEMKTAVHELLSQPADSHLWLKKARSLYKLIQAHVREEEEIVFPALRQRLSHRDNARLTRAMRREGSKVA